MFAEQDFIDDKTISDKILDVFIIKLKEKLNVDKIELPDTLINYDLVEYGLLSTGKYEIDEETDNFLPLTYSERSVTRLLELIDKEVNKAIRRYFKEN